MRAKPLHAPALAPGHSTFSAFAAGLAGVLIWHDCVSLEGVARIRQVFSALREKHPTQSLGFLTIGERQTDIRTSPEIRKQMSQLLAEFEPCLRAAAIVYEARGFKATIARSVITGINIASRARFPNRVFEDAGEAVLWLEGITGSRALREHPQLQRYFGNG